MWFWRAVTAVHGRAGEQMDETVEGAAEGEADVADAARRRRVRRATVWGGIASAATVVPLAVEGPDHMPWWLSTTIGLVMCTERPVAVARYGRHRRRNTP